MPLNQCAVFGCEEPRCVQKPEHRFVAKDHPEEIGRRFCIRHAFEYDRERVAEDKDAEVIVLLFPVRRAA